MDSRKYLDLKHFNGSRLYVRESRLESSKEELEKFLESERHLQTRTFAKNVMFSHEIKSNNQVEGYGDDIEIVKRVIKDAESIKDEEQRARILNLYHAYNYILKGNDINPETLKKLYSITSKNALNAHDRTYMGEYYRTKPVYILRAGRLDLEPYQGVPADRIEEFLEEYFNFLNTSDAKGRTEEYIKSQILHYYFVYVHPYFDVNGRTSRTLSMWYLLNKKVYPYIIFNRGISFKGSDYDKTIIRVRNTNDLTYFLEFMLDTVKVELEKEYVMQIAASNATSKLNATDYQTLLYYLSMKGLRSVLDFARMYNNENDKKKAIEIYEEMILPLLDKGVLEVVGETKKEVNGMPNKILSLRKQESYDPEKVKNLKL